MVAPEAVLLPREATQAVTRAAVPQLLPEAGPEEVLAVAPEAAWADLPQPEAVSVAPRKADPEVVSVRLPEVASLAVALEGPAVDRQISLDLDPPLPQEASPLEVAQKLEDLEADRQALAAPPAADRQALAAPPAAALEAASADLPPQAVPEADRQVLAVIPEAVPAVPEAASGQRPQAVPEAARQAPAALLSEAVPAAPVELRAGP